MSDVVAHARAEDQSDHTFRSTIEYNEGRLGIEDAAPRESHDVIQEAQRSAQRVVLIVNLRVDVPTIRSGDNGGRGLIIAFGPGTDLYVRVRRSFFWHSLPHRQHHEQAGVPLKSSIEKRTRNGVGLVR